MKTVKVLLISIFTILATLYLAFIFVFPKFITLDRYTDKITQEIQKNTKLQIKLKNIKIKTGWDFSVKTLVNKTEIMYPTGEKFAQINNLEIKLSLIPILFKKIQIDKIYADKVMLNLDVDKNGNLILKEYFGLKKPVSGINFSNKQPDIFINKYRISVLEKNNPNKYTIKGSDLKITDFIFYEKVKISTTGHLEINEKKQILYDIKIFSKTFPQENKNNILTLFKEIQKYNLKVKLNTNIIITKEETTGELILDKISFIFGEKLYPASSLKINFKEEKALINASLHTSDSSKALVTGLFKFGKNKFIDLHVISDKVEIKDILLITKAMSKPFGLNKLKNIDADGIIQANFNIKSDFKKLISSGYLKVKNATIIDKINKISVNSINSNIDFSKDSIILNNTNAMLNNQLLEIKGRINKYAIADINITGKNLPLKGVLLATGQNKILNENNISGIVNLNIYINGKLNKISPKTFVSVKNLDIFNKLTKAQTKATQANIEVTTNKETDGIITITGLKTNLNNSLNITIPKLNLILSKNELNIQKTYLYVEDIRTWLSGKISNIHKNPVIEFINISIPSQISIPVKGYKNSNALVKGDINITGTINNPKIHGDISIPVINIPQESIFIKNITLKISDKILLNCPHIQVANSTTQMNGEIDKNFSSGITLKNTNFTTDNINLNQLLPILKNLPKNPNSDITITSAKSYVTNFKVGNIVSSEIISDIKFKNNILYINNLSANAYSGKIAGNINYNINKNQTSIDIQGRNLSANPAISAISGRNDDILGKLSFDSNISFVGQEKRLIQKSLTGNILFEITNGKMGILGKLEHLLYAQNIISNNIFKANLNTTTKAITAKNTGVYKYMRGKIDLSKGWANINWIKTSGPSMSLYMKGRYYIPDNTANLTILGRISDDVVKVLGPVGEFSMNKIFSNIPKIGEITAQIANQFTTNPNYENTSQIPSLTPKTNLATKEFKVVIDGDIQKQNSVKSFKWLSTPKIIKTVPSLNTEKQNQEIPQFVKNLPNFN